MQRVRVGRMSGIFEKMQTTIGCLPDWPAAKNMKHNCFVGMDLPQFEDVLEEPDLDIFETENLRLNPKRWFGLV